MYIFIILINTFREPSLIFQNILPCLFSLFIQFLFSQSQITKPGIFKSSGFIGLRRTREKQSIEGFMR